MESQVLIASLILASWAQAAVAAPRCADLQGAHNIPLSQQGATLQWAQSIAADKIPYLNELDASLLEDSKKPDQYVFPRKVDIPTRQNLPLLKPDQRCRINETVEAYSKQFGRNTLQSFLWSGIEVGNQLTHDLSERWNSLELSGMYDKEKRKAMINSLNKLGIRNLRFGLSNHQITPRALKNLKAGQVVTAEDLKSGWDESSWQQFDEMIDHLSSAGIRLSLDLHHFGIEDFFAANSKGQFDMNHKTYDPTKSFYLNPKWPDYFADFALAAFKRYKGKVQALTIINEPAITSAFNGQLWHGGYPGWASPLALHYETERAIRIGMAAVRARTKIEKYINALPAHEQEKARVVYLQSEGMFAPRHDQNTYKAVRFMTLDLILGQEWLYKTDFRKMKQMSLDQLVKFSSSWAGPLEGMVAGYIFFGQPEDQKIREQQRDRLFALLHVLQQDHLTLRKETGHRMQDFTVLGIDYYSHNEGFDPDGKPLSKEPQDYPQEVRKGRRVGMYHTAPDYWTRYPVPLMITETGTAYWGYGSAWNQQMLVESAKFAEHQIPFLGFTFYPAVDTYGWEHALSQKREGSLLNESGIMNFSMQPKPYLGPIMEVLRENIPSENNNR